MFTTLHFIWLAICASIITVSVVLAKKFKPKTEFLLTLLCIACAVSEVVKLFAGLIAEENFNESYGGNFIKLSDLPFHLCSIQIIFAFVAKFTKKESVREFCLTFMMPCCILGGIMALLIPTNGVTFTSARTYQFFLYHAAIISFSLALIAIKGVRLNFKTYLRTLLTLAVLVIFSFYINGLTQKTNFFYVSKPPMKGLPILNLDNGWFVYFLSYLALALTLFTLFYVPFFIINRKRI